MIPRVLAWQLWWGITTVGGEHIGEDHLLGPARCEGVEREVGVGAHLSLRLWFPTDSE